MPLWPWMCRRRWPTGTGAAATAAAGSLVPLGPPLHPRRASARKPERLAVMQGEMSLRACVNALLAHTSMKHGRVVKSMPSCVSFAWPATRFRRVVGVSAVNRRGRGHRVRNFSTRGRTCNFFGNLNVAR